MTFKAGDRVKTVFDTDDGPIYATVAEVREDGLLLIDYGSRCRVSSASTWRHAFHAKHDGSRHDGPTGNPAAGHQAGR